MGAAKHLDPGLWPVVTAVLPERDNGCDWVRVVNPFVHLKLSGYRVWTAHQIKTIQHRPDVIVLQRYGVKEPEMVSWLISDTHAHGTAVVIDHDDDNRLTAPVQEDLHVPEAHQWVRDGMARADALTVTTEYLAARLREENPHVVVLPNLVDPDQWRLPVDRKWRLSQRIVVGCQGGITHLHDWRLVSELWPILADQFPTIDFLLVNVGRSPDWLTALRERLGPRLLEPKWLPSNQYQYNTAQVDIGWCPLEPTEFNRCRSPLKWLEHSMCAAPVVASPTLYADYIRPGRTGFLAESDDDWLRYTSELIKSASLRRRIGYQAKLEVERDYNVHDPRQQEKRMLAYRDTWERARGEPYGRYEARHAGEYEHGSGLAPATVGSWFSNRGGF